MVDAPEQAESKSSIDTLLGVLREAKDSGSLKYARSEWAKLCLPSGDLVAACRDILMQRNHASLPTEQAQGAIMDFLGAVLDVSWINHSIATVAHLFAAIDAVTDGIPLEGGIDRVFARAPSYPEQLGYWPGLIRDFEDILTATTAGETETPTVSAIRDIPIVLVQSGTAFVAYLDLELVDAPNLKFDLGGRDGVSHWLSPHPDTAFHFLSDTFRESVCDAEYDMGMVLQPPGGYVRWKLSGVTPGVGLEGHSAGGQLLRGLRALIGNHYRSQQGRSHDSRSQPPGLRELRYSDPKRLRDSIVLAAVDSPDGLGPVRHVVKKAERAFQDGAVRSVVLSDRQFFCREERQKEPAHEEFQLKFREDRIQSSLYHYVGRSGFSAFIARSPMHAERLLSIDADWRARLTLEQSTPDEESITFTRQLIQQEIGRFEDSPNARVLFLVGGAHFGKTAFVREKLTHRGVVGHLIDLRQSKSATVSDLLDTLIWQLRKKYEITALNVPAGGSEAESRLIEFHDILREVNRRLQESETRETIYIDGLDELSIDSIPMGKYFFPGVIPRVDSSWWNRISFVITCRIAPLYHSRWRLVDKPPHKRRAPVGNAPEAARLAEMTDLDELARYDLYDEDELLVFTERQIQHRSQDSSDFRLAFATDDDRKRLARAVASHCRGYFGLARLYCDSDPNELASWLKSHSPTSWSTGEDALPEKVKVWARGEVQRALDDLADGWERERQQHKDRTRTPFGDWPSSQLVLGAIAIAQAPLSRNDVDIVASIDPWLDHKILPESSPLRKAPQILERLTLHYELVTEHCATILDAPSGGTGSSARYQIPLPEMRSAMRGQLNRELAYDLHTLFAVASVSDERKLLEQPEPDNRRMEFSQYLFKYRIYHYTLSRFDAKAFVRAVSERHWLERSDRERRDEVFEDLRQATLAGSPSVKASSRIIRGLWDQVPSKEPILDAARFELQLRREARDLSPQVRQAIRQFRKNLSSIRTQPEDESLQGQAPRSRAVIGVGFVLVALLLLLGRWYLPGFLGLLGKYSLEQDGVLRTSTPSPTDSGSAMLEPAVSERPTDERVATISRLQPLEGLSYIRVNDSLVQSDEFMAVRAGDRIRVDGPGRAKMNAGDFAGVELSALADVNLVRARQAISYPVRTLLHPPCRPAVRRQWRCHYLLSANRHGGAAPPSVGHLIA